MAKHKDEDGGGEREFVVSGTRRVPAEKFEEVFPTKEAAQECASEYMDQGVYSVRIKSRPMRV